MIVVAFTVSGCVREEAWQIPVERYRTIDSVDYSTAPAPEPVEATPVEPRTWPAEARLTLADVRSRTINNNLDIKVATVDPTIGELRVTQEEAAFDATFTTRVNYLKLDQPTGTTQGESGLPVARQNETISVTPGIGVPLATGGSVSFATPMQRQGIPIANSGRELVTYETDLTVSVRQPLLRGAGDDAVRQRLRVASYQRQQSEARTKVTVIRALAEADRAYWNLAASRDQLAVRSAQLSLAQAQLDRARRQADAGVVAEVEVVRAEAGLSDIRELIITAEADVRLRQRELKRLMNDGELPPQSTTVLVPESPPTVLEIKLDEGSLLASAQANRAELLDAELQILEQNANIAAAKNAMLPLVSLEYQYNLNGLGRDFGDSYSQLADNDFADHRVGLQVEVPVGNRAARSAYRSSLLRRIQLLSTQDNRRLQINQEVLNASDALTTAWERVVSAQERVRQNQRLLDAEVRQFDQGLRTSTDVVEAVTRLGDAQSALVQAQTSYQIAQVDVAFATGLILGQAGVSWTPAPIPQ
jgi:outer membrane protein TolC